MEDQLGLELRPPMDSPLISIHLVTYPSLQLPTLRSSASSTVPCCISEQSLHLTNTPRGWSWVCVLCLPRPLPSRLQQRQPLIQVQKWPRENLHLLLRLPDLSSSKSTSSSPGKRHLMCLRQQTVLNKQTSLMPCLSNRRRI